MAETLFARLAETEFTYLVDPRFTIETQFGIFYNHADFPTRYDAHQLVRCRCSREQIDDLRATLDSLYANTGLGFQKISGYDPETYMALQPLLETEGWEVKRAWMMTLENEPERLSNPEISIVSVGPDTQHLLDHLQFVDGELTERQRFYRAQDDRVGGERLVAMMHGEPIASSGWYVVDGIARFRRLATVEKARGQGAATTLIRYVQDQPTVQAQDWLTIFCLEDGPVSLYEQLGFVKRHWMWEMVHFPVCVSDQRG